MLRFQAKTVTFLTTLLQKLRPGVGILDSDESIITMRIPVRMIGGHFHLSRAIMATIDPMNV